MRSAMLLAALTLSACGASSMQRHATAARATSAALSTAGDSIDVACSPERSQAMGEGGATVAEHEAHITRCNRAAETQHATVELWRQWVAYLLIAAEGERFDAGLALQRALALVPLYAELAEALGAFGVDAPALPALLSGGE
jgi:hypothetical protein